MPRHPIIEGLESKTIQVGFYFVMGISKKGCTELYFRRFP